MPRCAVVYNPIKVSTYFHPSLEARLGEEGWTDTFWLETTEEDPGRGMTRTALEAGVDLVIAAGGDGTVRVVSDGLADSGVPMGIIPAGTANLLARNLGVPLKEADAIDVALARHTRPIDLISLQVDDSDVEHFAVIAGLGVDAVIMDETDPRLKATIGPAAYFVATAKALGRLPMQLEVVIDGGRPRRRRKAMICAVGNVGDLPGITLIPGASPDDGLLDIFIASPHRFMHWFHVVLRLITRRRQSDDQVDHWVGRRVEIRLLGPESYQLDGDVVGKGRRLVAEVNPGALAVCIPDETPAGT